MALVAGLSTAVAVPSSASDGRGATVRGTSTRAQVFLDWERVLFRTVYTEGLTPTPTGIPLLGFTSKAMYDATYASLERRRSSEKAAVAAAAHGVLLHYFPLAQPQLDANLLATLAAVPDGRAEDRGRRIGEAAAADMVASRQGDGYGDETIHYNKPRGVGIWQPTPPATDMLGAWLGSLRQLVPTRLVAVNGPDPVTSKAYADDFAEVKAEGGATSTVRTRKQTLTAWFFSANIATMLGDALVRYLEEHPMGVRRTARLFGVMHAAMTNTIIRCWELKRDVGFWRPGAAIPAAGGDGNPATRPDAGWTPLLASPPYSDYVSGHACGTSAAVETIRRILGEHTALELFSSYAPRSRVYRDLTTLERQALNARIWGGLHFRDAMVDGYHIGHTTARRVLARLP
jgi:hypothetical protein